MNDEQERQVQAKFEPLVDDSEEKAWKATSIL